MTFFSRLVRSVHTRLSTQFEMKVITAAAREADSAMASASCLALGLGLGLGSGLGLA